MQGRVSMRAQQSMHAQTQRHECLFYLRSRRHDSVKCFRHYYVGLQFTNMGQGFQGTLDYVLYTTNSLVPTATLELPDESDIKDTRNSKAGLPNETWSSDHIALLAEFQYKQT